MMTPEERAELKVKIAAAQELKNAMTVEEKIALMNTPYSQLPDELKPGMVKKPQKFNFVRMSHPSMTTQKETFAARLIRYRDKYHLSQQQFCDIANEFGKKFGTKLTLRDMSNYENFNVCPKIDKMTLIAKTMGVGIDYFAGYGSKNRKCNNPVIAAREFMNPDEEKKAA